MVEQFVEAFFHGALDRAPTDAERSSWVTRLRSAQGQGQAALLAEARTLGSTLFGSAEYAGRQRGDEEFVHDLYRGYLQRAADADGFLHWLTYTRANGRAATVTAFGQSAEFSNLVGALCAGGQLTGELHWVLAGHVGSARVVLNSGGAVVGRRDHLPFGDALRDVAEGGGLSPLGAQASEPTGLWGWADTVRVRYAGMEKDAPTGLEHTPFRKYDAGWGRWTTPDPYPGSMNITDPQTFNRYPYVTNDPVNRVDPSGLEGIVIDTGPPVTVIGNIEPISNNPLLSLIWGSLPGRRLRPLTEGEPRPGMRGGGIGGVVAEPHNIEPAQQPTKKLCKLANTRVAPATTRPSWRPQRMPSFEK